MSDPLVVLRDAGVPVDQLSAAQRLVLGALSESEVAVLVSVQQRLRAVEPEVLAHGFKLL